MKEGDSDDEIAELRIQALLTKRENEAEISPAHEPHSKPPPPHNALNQPLSNYRHSQNYYGNRTRPYQRYYNHSRPYHYNNKEIRGEAINSSNIVVLTSSENKPSWDDRPGPNQGGNWGRIGNDGNKSISVAVQKTQAPPLILPQDANSKDATPTNVDPNKAKLSARMRRLQLSGSDSDDSESDSSDDSSSDSSSSDSSSDSSSSDSDSDSDTSSDGPKSEKGKDAKESKLESEKADNQGLSGKQVTRNEKSSNLVNSSSQAINKHTTSPSRGAAPSDSSNKKRHASPRREGHSTHNDSSGTLPLHNSRSSEVTPSKRLYSPSRNSLSPRLRNSSYRRSRSLSRGLSKSPLRKKSPKRGSLTPPRGHLSRRYSKSPPRRFRSKSPGSKYPRYRSKSRSLSKPPFSSRRYYRSRSPISKQFTRDRSYSPLPPRKFSSKSPPPRKLSPLPPRKFGSKSPPPRMLSPLRRYGSRSPFRRYSSRSPPPRRYASRSPPPRRYISRSPPPRRYASRSPLPRRLSRSPLLKKSSPNKRTPPPRGISRTPPRKMGGRQKFSKSPLSRGNSPLGGMRRSRSPLLRRLGSWSPKRKNFDRSPYGSPSRLHSTAPLQSPSRKFAPRSPYRSPSPFRGKKRSPLRDSFPPGMKRGESPFQRYELPPDSAKSRLLRRSLSPRSNAAKPPASSYGNRSPYQQKTGGLTRPFSPMNRMRSNSPPYIRGSNLHPSEMDPKGSHQHFARSRSPYRRSNSPHPPLSNSSGNLRPLRHWSPHKAPPPKFPEEQEQVASYPQKFEDPGYGLRPPYQNNIGAPLLRHPPPLVRHPPPHLRPPPLRSQAPFAANSHSLMRPPYLENRSQPSDRAWPSGPNRNFGEMHPQPTRGGRGYPRMERYGESLHSQHPTLRGRGTSRGPPGRGIHNRLGTRGPWHEGAGGQRVPEEPLDDKPYYDAPPHHSQRKEYSQEGRSYHEAHDSLAPMRFSPPPQRRVPRGPRTPPYSPQREPSPLEWQKQRKLGKERTPTLSPSPPKDSEFKEDKVNADIQKPRRKRSRSRESSKVYPQEAVLPQELVSQDEKRPPSQPNCMDEYSEHHNTKYKPRKKEGTHDNLRHKLESEREHVSDSKVHHHPAQLKTRERSREQDTSKYRRDYHVESKHRRSSSERPRHAEKKPEKGPTKSPHLHRERQPHSSRNRSPRQERNKSPREGRGAHSPHRRERERERKEGDDASQRVHEKSKDKNVNKGRKEEEEESRDIAKHDKKKKVVESSDKRPWKSQENREEAKLCEDDAPHPVKVHKAKQQPSDENKKSKQEEEEKKKKKKKKKDEDKVKSSKKKKKEKEKEKKKKKELKKKKKHKSHEKLHIEQDENMRREKKEDAQIHSRSKEDKRAEETMKHSSDRSRSGTRTENEERGAFREDGKWKRSNNASRSSSKRGDEERRRDWQEERAESRRQKEVKVYKEDRDWKRAQRHTFSEDVAKGNKGFVVTVGTGSNRQVTEGTTRNISKAREKSGDSNSPRIPVHLRLGPRDTKEGKGGARQDDDTRRGKGAGGRSNLAHHKGGRHPRRETNSERRPRKAK